METILAERESEKQPMGEGPSKFLILHLNPILHHGLTASCDFNVLSQVLILKCNIHALSHLQNKMPMAFGEWVLCLLPLQTG